MPPEETPPGLDVLLPTGFPSRTPFNLEQARDVVWDTLLQGTRTHTPTGMPVGLNESLTRILETTPVTFSGIMTVDGEEALYFGIDDEYYEEHGAKGLRRALEQQFPSLPIHIEPSEGIVQEDRDSPSVKRSSGDVSARSSGALVFTESPNFYIADNTHSMQRGGAITVPGADIVDSVSVSVRIDHSYVSDLRVEIVSPTGVSVTLYDGPSGQDDDSDNLVYSWHFPNSFRGLPAGGVWQLLVGDYVKNDDGVLRSWELVITPTGEQIRAPELPGEPGSDAASALFFDDFEHGLGEWIVVSDSRDVGWRTTELDEGDSIPGDDSLRNIVAQSDECDKVCTLTLARSIDLTPHDSMLLSFDRWVDGAIDRDEYLKVEVGNNGSYREIAKWSSANGGDDDRWHHEVFELSAEDLSSSRFTVRFTSLNGGHTEEVAIDNVLISPVDAVSPDEQPGIFDGNPPYSACSHVPERSDPIGGDIIFARPMTGEFLNIACGTLSLAGVRTNDGREGVITSAHFIDPDYRDADVFVGHAYHPDVDGFVRHPIGKVGAMPFIWREAVAGWLQREKDPALIADAAFVEYPQSRACSVQWDVDNDSYCFRRDYMRQADPMKIRGRGGAVYAVTGYETPVVGLSVMMSGAMSGVTGPGEIVHQLIKIDDGRVHQHVYAISDAFSVRSGDSGAPVYTEPNVNGEVSIVGVLIGSMVTGGNTYRIFSSWGDVDEALHLRPL